jgi:hypothetical protein
MRLERARRHALHPRSGLGAPCDVTLTGYDVTQDLLLPMALALARGSRIWGIAVHVPDPSNCHLASGGRPLGGTTMED